MTHNGIQKPKIGEVMFLQELPRLKEAGIDMAALQEIVLEAIQPEGIISHFAPDDLSYDIQTSSNGILEDVGNYVKKVISDAIKSDQRIDQEALKYVNEDLAGYNVREEDLNGNFADVIGSASMFLYQAILKKEYGDDVYNGTLAKPETFRLAINDAAGVMHESFNEVFAKSVTHKVALNDTYENVLVEKQPNI